MELLRGDRKSASASAASRKRTRARSERELKASGSEPHSHREVWSQELTEKEEASKGDVMEVTCMD